MENIVPFLLAGAYFIYQMYANYQKEQEKAKNRNPGQPYTEDEVFTEQRPMVEDFPEFQHFEEATESVPQTIAENKGHIPQVRDNLYDDWNSTDVPDDVLRMRKYRAAKKEALLSIEPLELEIVDEDEEAAVAFDLRTAVIHSIILDRPYA